MSFTRFLMANPTATIEPIDGLGFIYFKNRWRIYGGWDSTGTLPYDRNTQYSSKNLFKWTQERDADWAPSHSFGLVHDKINDVLFKIGSDGQPDTTPLQRSQIWTSSDGINWDLVASHSFLSDLVLFFSVVKGSDVYIGGGQRVTGVQGAWTVTNANLNTKIWKSSDGCQTFTEITDGAYMFGGNIGRQVIYFEAANKFIGVCTPSVYDDAILNRTYVKTCWISDDCITWLPFETFPGPGRQYGDLTEHKGRIYLLNGGNGGNLADIYYLNTGLNWACMPVVPLRSTHATGWASNGKILAAACGNLFRTVYYMEEYNF
jgi:hypothetical protein